MKYIGTFLPIVAWLAAGSLKFSVNYLRLGSAAVDRIGNGGFPSTHTTIVSSVVMLIGFNQGFDSLLFSLGAAMLIITIIDATGIRNAVGLHAKALNCLDTTGQKLRESQGHSFFEVLGGLLLGTALGYIANLLR